MLVILYAGTFAVVELSPGSSKKGGLKKDQLTRPALLCLGSFLKARSDRTAFGFNDLSLLSS